MLYNGPLGGVEIFKKRRQKLMERIKDGVAILPANPEVIRNNDVHYDFRQDSSFYYLTGYTEPECVVVIAPHYKHKFMMFVREKNPLRELWDGFRYGVEGTQEKFAVDQVYPIGDFENIVTDVLKGVDKIYYRLAENREFDEKILGLLNRVRLAKGRTGAGLHQIADVQAVIGELRLFKSKEELDLMRKTCEISAHGHIAAMRFTKPGVWEYEIQAVTEKEFRMRGAERLGYGSIVGRGANATVLHYIYNRDKCVDGDLLLIDAGAEYGYMSGDITRTFPVNGKFEKAQKRFYEAVLKVQKSCITKVKPGVKLADIHAHAIDGLTEEMLSMGLLSGNSKTIIQKTEYTKYFPHGTSHWLGMDVHDHGLYKVDGEPRRLEPGMCFTVEPGLYVPLKDKNAPKEFRGLGVRIEDDVFVTAKGCEVMTDLAPKEVEEIEAIVGKSE